MINLNEKEKKRFELICDKYSKLTPLEISDFMEIVTIEQEIAEKVTTVRLQMMLNLIALSNELFLAREECTTLSDKVTLAKEITSIYSEINSVTKSLVNPGKLTKPCKITPVSAPYIDYTKRTPRSQVWRDYVSWCESNGTLPVNKKYFFDDLLKSGFRLGKSAGDIMLIPPRVR